jgi:hypothetical protein
LCGAAPVVGCASGQHAREEKIMRLVIGFVFVALAVTPAASFEGCARYSKVVASTEAATPATPVQTAEVPTTTQTK